MEKLQSQQLSEEDLAKVAKLMAEAKELNNPQSHKCKVYTPNKYEYEKLAKYVSGECPNCSKQNKFGRLYIVLHQCSICYSLVVECSTCDYEEMLSDPDDI
jgi:hypothetical protein